jgi:hypothetical protein
MVQPLAHETRDLIDVPISDLRLTDKGRQELANGEIELAMPGFDPVLALDLLSAVAWCEDNYGPAGPSS